MNWIWMYILIKIWRNNFALLISLTAVSNVISYLIKYSVIHIINEEIILDAIDNILLVINADTTTKRKGLKRLVLV